MATDRGDATSGRRSTGGQADARRCYRDVGVLDGTGPIGRRSTTSVWAPRPRRPGDSDGRQAAATPRRTFSR